MDGYQNRHSRVSGCGSRGREFSEKRCHGNGAPVATAAAQYKHKPGLIAKKSSVALSCTRNIMVSDGNCRAAVTWLKPVMQCPSCKTPIKWRAAHDKVVITATYDGEHDFEPGAYPR
jgi:hypothetical protein